MKTFLQKENVMRKDSLWTLYRDIQINLVSYKTSKNRESFVVSIL